MENVQVTIDGIILYCDESIQGLQLGNGYSIKKVYLKDISFKNKITDGNGKININYMGSSLSDDNEIYFMCIHKEESYQIQLPQTRHGIRITGKDLMWENQLDSYKDKEIEYLNRQISLLHLFEKGNIGYKEIFFEHHFTVMGFINNTQKQTSNSVTKNIVDNTFFSLASEKLNACNQFLQNNNGREFDLLKNCIDEFTWGLEQVDIPTGFEQYTTTLEMILLNTNQKGKKEVLSKRVAVLLEDDSVSILKLYEKMKNFYRYRSESLHEGDGRNITNSELKDMEGIVRRVLLEYLDLCKSAIQNNVSSTWNEVKNAKITDLMNAVGIANL